MNLNHKLNQLVTEKAISRFGIVTLTKTGLNINYPENILLPVSTPELNQAVETALQQMRSLGLPQLTVPINLEALLYISFDGIDNDEQRFRLEVIPNITPSDTVYTEQEHFALLIRMLSELVHDIRSPVNTSLLGLDTVSRQLTRGFEVEKLLELINKLKPESVKPLKLVEKYRVLLQSLTGTEIQTHQQVNISELINEVLDEVGSTASINRIEFSFGGLSTPDIFTQRDKLFFIIKELLQNALLHSPQHSIVNLNISQLGDNLNVQVINKTQTSPIDKKSIFTPFYRGDDVKLTPSKNYGLGLNLLNKYTQDLDGRLKVDIDESANAFQISSTLPILSQKMLDEYEN